MRPCDMREYEKEDWWRILVGIFSKHILFIVRKIEQFQFSVSFVDIFNYLKYVFDFLASFFRYI